MSLALNTPQDPFELIRKLRNEIDTLKVELRDSQQSLREERMKAGANAEGVRQLQGILQPLYRGLQQIFGEIEAMNVGSSVAVPTDSRIAAIWSDWKQKFPGHPARAIDALMLHGSMTQSQLRIAVGCATGTISNVVSILNKAGLINKNGGKISLKEL